MNKGLASFEFLLMLGLILLVTSTLIVDSLDESRKTVVFSTSKSVLLGELETKSINSTNCSNPQIESYQVEGNTLTFNLDSPQCHIDPSQVADPVERDICGVEPNQDNIIICGSESFEVNIQ